eukprot:5392500-Lingulodinium_polyedra.AAC.1
MRLVALVSIFEIETGLNVWDVGAVSLPLARSLLLWFWPPVHNAAYRSIRKAVVRVLICH